jgi:hypothetical protein
MNDFDPDAFLKGAPATVETAIKGEKPVSDFNPDAFLGTTKTEAEAQQITKAPEATPMPQFAVPGPTGFSASAVGKTLSPVIEAVKNIPKNVYTAPGGGINMTALADAYATLHGVPAPIATAKTIYQHTPEMYQAAKDALSTGGKIASKFAEASDLNNAYHPMRQAVAEAAPGVEAKISEIFRTGGGNQGVKTWLTTTEEGKQFLSNPVTKPLVEKYLGAVPSTMTQVGKVVGPVLRGAGKVLGPAGLAMNAYDASQYAEAAKLGERLAGGQGQMAQQAYRHNAVSMPTPQQLQPTEAANLLASGDQRTIQIYGGQQHLQAIAGGKSPSAPPTADNFIERMRAMANQYGTIK